MFVESLQSNIRTNLLQYNHYPRNICDYLDIARLYVKLYDWSSFAPTVHKVLIHRAAIMALAILPI